MRIQTHLTKLGYYNGNISGIANKATKLAIGQFQADSNLEVDGVPDSDLLHQLELARQ